jgi:hypothetical protein
MGFAVAVGLVISAVRANQMVLAAFAIVWAHVGIAYLIFAARRISATACGDGAKAR